MKIKTTKFQYKDYPNETEDFALTEMQAKKLCGIIEELDLLRQGWNRGLRMGSKDSFWYERKLDTVITIEYCDTENENQQE